MFNDSQTTLNHKLTLRIIELSIVTMLLALIIRPLLTELPVSFMWVGIADLLTISIFYFTVRSNLFPKWEIALSLLTVIIVITPILVLSGGVNSQLAFFLPLYPIMAALIGGHKESVIVTLVIISGTILGTVFSEHITDLTNEIYSEEKTIARGFWLTISTIFSAFFGRFFLQKYTQLTKQLKEENIQDPLTGLLNRRGLNLQFKRELEKAMTSSSSSLSLILIDIDYFKKINDKYGHDIGDVCLIEVAKVLSSALRKHDIIARFGGEEFIIVLPSTTKKEAQLIAEDLNYLITQGKFSEFSLPLTITLGVTSSREQHDNTLDMIKRADKALYRGKDNGRNCIELSD
ncbi:GGDEF domain-containing protein [Marinomonas profundimaris]|nr:GGDEF domain-containing protein [Marinomonas profundimaris]